MRSNLFLLVATAAATFSLSTSTSITNSQDIIRRSLEPLDPAGKYHLEYEINVATKLARFHVAVETKGYVGFGFSPNGGMTGADIVIGGVYDNGFSYFADRHGVGNSEPVIDTKQDYELELVYENATHTTLQFSRRLDTCDSQDVAITADTVKLIWSYGPTDVFQYHGSSRGSYSANLLDPPNPPFDESGFDKWTLVANTTMPKQPTSYWCTIHKSPTNYINKRHVVAFNTWLSTADSLRHTHHLTMYRCKAPDGIDPDKLFGPHVGHEGGECYVPPEQQVIPIDLCRDIIYGWAVGGRIMSLPDDVGYPINEDGRPEYMMVQIHYDNPDLSEGVRVETAIEIFNTPMLRAQEAAFAVLAHSVTFSHIVPGNTATYTTVGHCSARCTQDILPTSGINVFNVLLHSHKAGRKLRLRHFRGRTELPWIAADGNYDFDFQQNRPLRQHVRVLPGDHLTTECGQGTLGRNHVTIAGLGTTEEMCQSMIWYYPAAGLRFCESAYNEGKIMQQFEIEDLEWENVLLPPLIKAPESMANKTYLEVLNTMISWTPQYIADLEHKTRYEDHYQVICGGADSFRSMKEQIGNWRNVKEYPERGLEYDVGYPDLDSVYEPENPCL